MGGDGLEEEDQFLLEINLGDLELNSGEDQAYWLVEMKVARMAYQLRWQEQDRTRSQGI